jgi:hypothetical protein
LPSSEIEVLGFASGVADVAFIGNTMYAILAGAGCSHGVFISPGVPIPNGVIRINPDRSWTMIADLSAFLQAHPVAHPTDPITGDFEPDGTWYSMIALRGDLYAVEPNHGELDKITTDGKITRVIDISASQGHVVPTVVGDHGVFYVSNLGQFDPDQLNTQDVFQITPSGNLKVVATGLSKVLGLAGNLVLNEFPRSRTGNGSSYSDTAQWPAAGLDRQHGRHSLCLSHRPHLWTRRLAVHFEPWFRSAGRRDSQGRGQRLRCHDHRVALPPPSLLGVAAT